MNLLVNIIVLCVVALIAIWFVDLTVTEVKLNQIIKLVIFLLVAVYFISYVFGSL